VTRTAGPTATAIFTQNVAPWSSSRRNRILWFASGLFLLKF
jgi:hypothetical protein